MNIKFRDYEIEADRDERDVDDTFRKAVADCISPARRTTLLPDGENYWDSGRAVLGVKPEDGSESAIGMLDARAPPIPPPSPSLI